MTLSGLVPARFLTIVAHLVLTVVILWSRESNVKACLPIVYSNDDFNSKDTELIIGLSVTLGLLLLELIGFIGGLSMFMPTQGLISAGAHAVASLLLPLFLIDSWPCDLYWYIFGFCSGLPAVVELIIWYGVFVKHKPLL